MSKSFVTSTLDPNTSLQAADRESSRLGTCCSIAMPYFGLAVIYTPSKYTKFFSSIVRCQRVKEKIVELFCLVSECFCWSHLHHTTTAWLISVSIRESVNTNTEISLDILYGDIITIILLTPVTEKPFFSANAVSWIQIFN